LEVGIWCTQKEVFVTRAELGQVVEMFTIHIQALLNSADEWKTSNKLCFGMAAHDPSISFRNCYSVAGFLRYTASFKYPLKGK
jgi:hypothetical protein